MSFDNVQALPPGTRLGDYRLDAMIGHGGFGITYRAFDTQLAKVVAIKEYLPIEFAIRQRDGAVVPRGARLIEDFTWGRERFLDEARALARFRHPHIVPVLRYFEANGTAYTVMEFEDGKNVAELLRDPGRRLPADDVRRLADGLLSGLGAVHAQGFLHRDIKPANIIIRRDGVPVLDRFRRRAAGDGRPHAHAHQRAHAAIRADRAICPRRQAGRRGATSIPPPPCSITRSRDSRRPTRPRASARIPIGRWPRSQAIASSRPFLAAIDRALAFAPDDRPQSVADVERRCSASRCPGSRMRRRNALPTAPASRRRAWAAPAAKVTSLPCRRRGRDRRRRSSVRALLDRRCRAGHADAVALPAGDPHAVESAPSPIERSVARRDDAVAAGDSGATARTRSRRRDRAAIDPTRRCAEGDRSSRPSAPPSKRARCSTRAEEAAGTARASGGRGAHRGGAGRRGRTSSTPSACRTIRGASYVGQVVDGKRQGLGVAELANGERQAGDWQADQLNGLGTVRLADDTRYAGQWRDGQSTGLGVREKPGVERAEGNFVDGPPRRARRAAHAGRAQRGAIRRIPRRSAGGAGRRDRSATASATKAAFAAASGNGYGQVTAPTARSQPAAGRTESASNQRLERLAWKLRPAGCTQCRAP